MHQRYDRSRVVPPSAGDRTTCPECGADAVVEWRAGLESTDGPVEHAKVSCSQRHWFLLPVALLECHRRPGPRGRTR